MTEERDFHKVECDMASALPGTMYVVNRVDYMELLQAYEERGRELARARELAETGEWCPHCHAPMKPYTHRCESCKERVGVTDACPTGYLKAMEWV